MHNVVKKYLIYGNILYKYFFSMIKEKSKKQRNKKFCIPEGINTNISHKLIDCIITFVNSQHYNIDLKDDFVLKTRF